MGKAAVKEPFKPEKHFRNLKGQQYLDVKWRVVWFREEHPDGVISTTLLEHDATGGMAVFKAQAGYTLPDGREVYAVGHGSETRKDFGDYMEKSETKAIGRALAMLGYGTAQAQELDEEDRIVDSPVDRRPPRQDVASGGAPHQDVPRQPAVDPLAVKRKRAADLLAKDTEMHGKVAPIDQQDEEALDGTIKLLVGRANAQAKGQRFWVDGASNITAPTNPATPAAANPATPAATPATTVDAPTLDVAAEKSKIAALCTSLGYKLPKTMKDLQTIAVDAGVPWVEGGTLATWLRDVRMALEKRNAPGSIAYSPDSTILDARVAEVMAGLLAEHASVTGDTANDIQVSYIDKALTACRVDPQDYQAVLTYLFPIKAERIEEIGLSALTRAEAAALLTFCESERHILIALFGAEESAPTPAAV